MSLLPIGNNSLITNEQKQLAPNKLIGFCEHCHEWYRFTDDGTPGSRSCTTCGGKPSSKIGFQITTQRSFDPKAKKMTKAQLKKMGGLG